MEGFNLDRCDATVFLYSPAASPPELLMLDDDRYVFRIDAFTPETIPMARLAAYMAELAAMLGEEGNVHFEKITKGSAKLAVKVERPAVTKVRNNVNEARMGVRGTRGDRYRKLNEMLRSDNAEGTLKLNNSNILAFPGRKEPRPPKLGPFTQAFSRDGQLVRIGGKDKTAHASIQDAEGQTWSFEVSRGLARELAPHLFEGVIRLTGTVRATRNDDGEWSYDGLKAHQFEELRAESLMDTLGRIRALSSSETWLPDAWQRLAQERDDD
ncbi:hypothetical protein [Stenotrophomonas sp. PS02297]|uniref:hypothetical protein n=1 Tax=Stenotrophomonas sp. PS02297 TaxID=2991423 RepID=UPI00249CE569|nr:hypothetical protein [Stenotrophomonas sp. PS02297]